MLLDHRDKHLVVFKPETHWANRRPSEAFGESRTSSVTNLFGVFEGFGTVWTASALIQLAKSENAGCQPSEPLDTLVVCQLYGHCDWQCASESARCVGGAEFRVCR